MGLFNLFGGDKSQSNSTITTNTSDSYNQTYNKSEALNNVGNVYLGSESAALAGITGGTGSGVANLGPYLLAGGFILVGLWLLNRNK
jgi:hypothetical protein